MGCKLCIFLFVLDNDVDLENELPLAIITKIYI